MKPFLILVASLAAVHTCSGLSCEPCEQSECKRPTGCKFGTVLDICHCCSVCAKGPGQKCGGLWDWYGKCGAAFECQPLDGDPDEFLGGICVPLTERRSKREALPFMGRRAGRTRKMAEERSSKPYSGFPPHIVAMIKQHQERKMRMREELERKMGMRE
ncbi:single insulin-like growth factor-binding domain protein-2 [Penaeus japonicus]|uniref:single insulin-like growth factor-binding domain protein-2 n=1 Tax=Penaeus japonicus TaxID=27405 RepID=UPI001C711FB0|nr:single insulin-like growth factor-binding domain protein-2 [Penaeus japonicus]